MNAILNYCYAILEAESGLAASAMGLDASRKLVRTVDLDLVVRNPEITSRDAQKLVVAIEQYVSQPVCTTQKDIDLSGQGFHLGRLLFDHQPEPADL